MLWPKVMCIVLFEIQCSFKRAENDKMLQHGKLPRNMANLHLRSTGSVLKAKVHYASWSVTCSKPALNLLETCALAGLRLAWSFVSCRLPKVHHASKSEDLFVRRVTCMRRVTHWPDLYLKIRKHGWRRPNVHYLWQTALRLLDRWHNMTSSEKLK